MWTTAKLAEAAGVDPSAIRHLLLRGSLKGEKFGPMWMIPQEEGERYIQQRRARGKLPDQPQPSETR